MCSLLCVTSTWAFNHFRDTVAKSHWSCCQHSEVSNCWGMRSHTGAWWSRLTRVASNDWNSSAWVQDATLFLACLVTYSALYYMHINQLSMCMCLPILIYCTSTITSYVLFPIWPYGCLVYIRTKRIPIQRYTRSMLLGIKVLNPQHNNLYRKCQSSQLPMCRGFSSTPDQSVIYREVSLYNT